MNSNKPALRTSNISPGFLSIKWKSFIVISLILIIVNGSYYFYIYQTLNNGFANERLEQRERHLTSLKTLVRLSSRELQNIANLIPGLNGIRRFIEQQQWERAHSQLLKLWPSLQADYDIDGIIIFGENAEPIISTEFNTKSLLSNQQITDTVSNVEKTLVPYTRIVCEKECLHIAITPYLSEDSPVRTIAVFSSVADIVLNHSQIAAVDSGILNINKDTGESHIAALTNRSRLEPLITLADRSLDRLNESTQGRVISHGGRYFDLALSPVNDDSPGSNDFFVIVNDVTGSYEEIGILTKETLTQSILGLSISVIAILIVLWRPLNRLKLAAKVLPMLSGNKSLEARKELGKACRERKIFRDEMDLVINSSIVLSDRLEKLNTDIDSYTRTLADNMYKLKLEKDFTSFLIDTAQVIIMTLDNRGRIKHINRYGLEFTAAKREQIINRSLEEFLVFDKEKINFRAHIVSIIDKQLDGFTCENQLTTVTGLRKTVAWVHSYINSEDRRPAEILSVGIDITERKKAEKSISWLANHDPLTGLYNRRYFNEVFGNYLKQGERYNKTGALLFLDLDNFKFVNDTQGHQAGDKLIRDVAQSLKRITRNADIIARLGGDEFAIVIPDIDTEGAVEFCRDLNRRINVVIKPMQHRFSNVSTSIGVALFPQHGTTVNQLLANADLAMYQAKQSGKGGWHLFSDDEQARQKIRHHVNWKTKIENAIEHDQFTLFYQPILDIESGKVSHYEALLRMQDGNGEFLSPGPIIEVAEDTGLIHQIDKLVVEKAIERIRKDEFLTGDVSLSVNLSAHTFSDRKNIPLLVDMLKKSGINLERIIFEITETAALQDIGAACDLIEQLAAMGCRFAIDDFGVGFSSFYYLRELPVDYVKIDGSFIQELSKNTDDQLIVRAMSQIVRGFGKKTIAEYVEDKATLSLLRKYGIDYAQGYYIGMPDQRTSFTEQLAV